MEVVGSSTQVVAAGQPQYGYSTTTVVMWDHSPATYASAYLAMVTGLVCAALTWSQWSGLKGEMFGLCYQTVYTCLFQGVGFGMAGIAFHIVDTRAESVNADIWGNESGWIFPWILAVIFKPICTGCLLGACSAYVGTTVHRFRAAQAANAVGVVVAICEVYFVMTNDLKNSVTPEFYWGLFATGLACGLILIVAWGKVGMWWILAGLAIRFAGYLYAAFGPCFLSTSGHGVCFFLDDGRKDLIFDACMALSVIPVYFGAVTKSRNDSDYQELLAKEAAARAPKDTRDCCTRYLSSVSGGH